MIELNNISTVLNGKVIHDGINLKIREGETKVIIGGSGVGKSVLIKIINKLLTPTSGEILFDNEDILKMSEKQFFKIRRRMSVLFQGGALFDSMNVFDNVAFPLRRLTKYKEHDIRDIVMDKLQLVGLKNFENKSPAEISAGMAKRVGLARAVVTNPEYVFYDEPTTGIDPVMGGIINDLIIKMGEELKVASIVVTHDMNSAFSVGNSIAMIYKGKVIFEGTPQQVKECDNVHVKNFINGESKDISSKLDLL